MHNVITRSRGTGIEGRVGVGRRINLVARKPRRAVAVKSWGSVWAEDTRIRTRMRFKLIVVIYFYFFFVSFALLIRGHYSARAGHKVGTTCVRLFLRAPFPSVRKRSQRTASN